MKKTLAMILTFVLCISLCACGKSEAVTNVEGLIAAIGEVTVESESAITAAEEAYYTLTEEEKAKVENYAVLIAAKDSLRKANFFGEWALLNSAYVFTFTEDGKCTYARDNQSVNSIFEFTDNGIETSADGLLFELVYQEKDGIEYLVCESLNLEMVRTEYATATEYEINMDNWQDFFTIEEKTGISKNGFGEIQAVNHFQVLELREEYRRRLAAMEDTGKYSIAVESMFTRKAALCELNGEEVSFVESAGCSLEDETVISDINQRGIAQYYNVNNTEDSPNGVSIAVGHTFHFVGEDGIGVYLIDDLKINRIQGTLLLYDLPLNNQMTKNTDKAVIIMTGPVAEAGLVAEAPVAEAPAA